MVAIRETAKDDISHRLSVLPLLVFGEGLVVFRSVNEGDGNRNISLPDEEVLGENSPDPSIPINKRMDRLKLKVKPSDPEHDRLGGVGVVSHQRRGYPRTHLSVSEETTTATD